MRDSRLRRWGRDLLAGLVAVLTFNLAFEVTTRDLASHRSVWIVPRWTGGDSYLVLSAGAEETCAAFYPPGAYLPYAVGWRKDGAFFTQRAAGNWSGPRFWKKVGGD